MSGMLGACAVFFAFGVAAAGIAFTLLRERLIDQALDRREREVYGPLLERVQAQQEQAKQRRDGVTRPVCTGSPGGISLEAFPIPKQRRPGPTH